MKSADYKSSHCRVVFKFVFLIPLFFLNEAILRKKSKYVVNKGLTPQRIVSFQQDCPIFLTYFACDQVYERKYTRAIGINSNNFEVEGWSVVRDLPKVIKLDLQCKVLILLALGAGWKCTLCSLLDYVWEKNHKRKKKNGPRRV